jgi:radical SAM protein with 4Fe4S-binding SPASM domain
MLYSELGYIDIPGSSNDSTLQRLFDKGHNMHDRWSRYAQDAGILRGYWQCKNPLCKMFKDDGLYDSSLDKGSVLKEKPRIYGKETLLGSFEPTECVCGCKSFDYAEVSVSDPELNMSGHCDMILDFSRLTDDSFNGVEKLFNVKDLPGGNVVVDMKTCRDSVFKKIGFSGPHEEYIIQLTIYINILGCDSGLLIYECKNSSNISAFKINKNENIFETIKGQAIILQDLAKEKKLPPPRPATKADYECKNCKFRKICHSSKIWQSSDLNGYRKSFYKNLLKK